MAIDRETIVSLQKKGDSNSTIAKELQTRRETVWKRSRTSGRQARHPIDRARAEREQFEPSEWLKHEGKVEDKSPSFGDQTGCGGWCQPDLDAPHP